MVIWVTEHKKQVNVLISSTEKCLSDSQEYSLLWRLLNFKRMRWALLGYSLFAEKIADMGFKWLRSREDNGVDIQAAWLCHLCEEIGWKAFKCWINDKQNTLLLRCILDDSVNRISIAESLRGCGIHKRRCLRSAEAEEVLAKSVFCLLISQ